MSEGEAVIYGLGVLVTLVILLYMIIKRPSEICEEKFEKRKW